MPDPAVQQYRFDPIHEAHAIEQAALTIQFVNAIDPARFQQAVDAFRREFASGDDSLFPGQMQFQQAVGFQIGSGGLLARQPSSGHMFNRYARSGLVEKELRIDGSSIVFTTAVYSRWADLASEAQRFLDVLLPFYGDALSFASFGYTVVDKFVWRGPAGECNPKLLLRAQSKYVCPHVFDVTDMWHSHTGVFIREDVNTKRLLNLNVDCLEEALQTGEARTVVSVTTVVTDSFNQPSYQPLPSVRREDAAAFVSTKMNALHGFSKKVFSETINDATCQRIALNLNP